MNEVKQYPQTMGSVAAKVIGAGYTCKCIGATSRGFFLHFSNNSAIFVSWEPWRGPLTINLRYAFNNITVGQELANGSQGIELNSIYLDPQKAHIFNGLQDLWAEEEGTAPSWPALPPDWPPPASNGLCQRAENMLRMAESCREPSMFSSLAWQKGSDLPDLLPLLGRGPGLTPSGDDFICGLFLLWYYCGLLKEPPQQSQIPYKKVVQEVLQAAWRKTTELSRCLLEVAQEGGADERILRLLAHIVYGRAQNQDFLSWGAHSCLDLLSGLVCGARLLSSNSFQGRER